MTLHPPATPLVPASVDKLNTLSERILALTTCMEQPPETPDTVTHLQ
ncbi:hypothetical protein PSP31121_05666 [Pandoraea sputorum]|uniref:Uncharacterized protein n=1 Tax=Pandoraea sputorum TaxID=93222 RepID=A0A5E5BL41_9BURK|nr:hypothetical protein PSP31121_05666 [Pandoraea sputorum]